MAMIIGISDYSDSGITDLKYASKDARDLYELVKAQGLFDSVYLLSDDAGPENQPTAGNILGRLAAITESGFARDSIFFFFSGHGVILQDGQYLVPKDATAATDEMFERTSIPLSMINDLLTKSEAQTQVIVLDACRNEPGKAFSGMDYTGFTGGADSLKLFSTKKGQRSWEMDERSNGAFAFQFIEGLKGAADRNGDGGVTAMEAAFYTREKVRDWAMAQNLVQVPQFETDSARDIMLGVTQPGYAAAVKPELSTVDVCPPEMVHIQPGSFIMGCSAGDDLCDADEKPAKKVEITKGFCMDIFEVTNRDYADFLNNNGNVCMGNECVESSSDWLKLQGSGRSWKVKLGYANHPVTEVSWYGATAYCESLGKQLPTEAQWEYAARAATDSRYYWGKNMPAGQANFCDINCKSPEKDTGETIDDGYEGTSPVGMFPANNYGLYDMAGNVWEWTEDCYDPDWYSSMPSQDPINASIGCALSSYRGGSWMNSRGGLRVSNRYREYPGNTGINLGFRCVKHF